MLKIYNTLTRKVEEFTPIVSGKVTMYACGVTVYDNCHIGHARTFIFFDLVVRYLQELGYDVNFVRNITDVDDKIIKRAQENKELPSELSARFIKALHSDVELLGLLQPTHEPRATAYISQMLELIQKLIQKNNAYVTASGDVYFSVASFNEYGKLSARVIADMQAGARVELNTEKRAPEDFALWKIAAENEIAWDSPWGRGRPGWHLECSTMALHLLGDTIDIHGGGNDLIFPHHENEIAQSECVTSKQFANFWLHVGFLQIKQEKMSKSLGNIYSIEDILAKVHPDVLRHFMLSGHYRSPLEFSFEQLECSKHSLTRWYQATRGLAEAPAAENTEFAAKFYAALNDDFNTAEAFAALHELATKINTLRQKSDAKAAELGAVLTKLAKVLGFYQQSADEFLHYQVKTTDMLTPAAIEELIVARNAARAAKDWSGADKIRQELLEQNVILEDTASGTIWRRG